MHIWIAVLPGYGHLFPTLPLARALESAGHVVTYCSTSRFANAIREHGFAHLSVGPDYALDGTGTALDGVAADASAIERLMFDQGPVVVARDLATLFESRRPDAMLVDPVDFGTMTACEAADVPWGAFLNGVRSPRMLGHLPFGIDERQALLAQIVDEPRQRRREAVGLGPSRLDPSEAPYDRTLSLMMAPPSLEAWPASVITHTGHPLRPEIHATEAEDLDPRAGRDRPLVVVTFGTLFGTSGLYRAAVTAALATGADVVVVTGEQLSVESDRLFQMRWASMDRLLARADGVVHHGGWGSTIAPLIAGTPSVVIPLGAEQPTNAARIASTGAGIWIEASAIATDLGPAIQRLLDDRVYRLNAERLKNEIEGMPPASEVVPLIERLATEGPPILRIDQ